MSSPDIEAIAAGLSEAQQRALVRAFENSPESVSVSVYKTTQSTRRVLYKCGLIRTAASSRQLSPLGLAVRQHLLKEKNDD